MKATSMPRPISLSEDAIPVRLAEIARRTDSFDRLLERFWVPPHDMERELREADLALFEGLHVRVSGETSNITLYVDDGAAVLAYMPFATLDQNPIVMGDAVHRGVFALDDGLRARMRFPRVLLINPCVLENFPVPRLCLSIGLLAGWLRRAQKADVRLIDMQMGTTVDQIMTAVETFAPELIGISISYGQKFVALDVVERIYDLKSRALCNALVVLGNVIPASFPDEFVHQYPGLLISTGEGETTIEALCDVLLSTRAPESVPGIAYAAGDSVVRTPKEPVHLPVLPLPSLDTLPDLARFRGAVTLELSRGCQWNVCTFCPRDHKSAVWKTYQPAQIIEQFARLERACDELGVTKHVFLADEEFVGGIDDGTETERLIEVAQGLIERGTTMVFDAAARVDQVFSPKMNEAWHVRRMEMWGLCRDAGLDRLFMGIESGSDTQLRRYGKGLRGIHSVNAIRILSALGVHLRFGFITFDQLMVGLRELKENIAFLERTDAYVSVDRDRYSNAELFRLLTNDEDFVREHSVGKPIYAGVSYMLASMEVLIGSTYARLLMMKDPRLVVDLHAPDTNMGRYRVEFIDPLVRDLSTCSQQWIDRHFSVAYTVKSLFKIAPPDQQHLLMDWMVAFRRTSLVVAKALVHLFDDEASADEPFAVHAGPAVAAYDAAEIDALRRDRLRSRREENRVPLIHGCLDVFDAVVGNECQILRRMLGSGRITDTMDGRLLRALDRWKERIGSWTLINDPEMALADVQH